MHSEKYIEDLKFQEDDKCTNFKGNGDVFTNEYTKRAAFLGMGACQ